LRSALEGRSERTQFSACGSQRFPNLVRNKLPFKREEAEEIELSAETNLRVLSPNE
jgi:hypothetical protein